MHTYKIDRKRNRVQLSFKQNINQDDMYQIAKTLSDKQENFQIVFDLSSLNDINSNTLGTIIALKAAYGWSSDKINLLGCNQDMQSLFNKLNISEYFTIH